MARPKPRRNAESYRAIAWKLSDMLREFRKLYPQRLELVAAMAREIAAHCWDELTLAGAQDIARWAGATGARRSYDETHAAIANAWIERDELMRASVRSSRAKRRFAHWRLKQRAYENARYVREQRDIERAEARGVREMSDLLASRDRQRATLARFAAQHGRTYAIVRIAA